MNKHTPGRWHAVGSWVEHEDDNVADICTCDPADIGQEHLGRTPKEIEANARLIAAAPDLLAALVEVTDRLTVFSTSANLNTRLALEAARAAIARAKGERL